METAGLHAAGVWMIVVSAVLFLILTLVVVRLLPGLVWPLYLFSWALGLVGFALVCIAEPTLFNIVIAVLFAGVAISHGLRLRRRAAALSETGSDD